MVDRLAPRSRHIFTHGGRKVYEWDQTLQEVNMYVDVPPGVKARNLFCNIGAARLSFGLAGNPPFLDAEFFAPVKVSESYWTLEDGTLHIQLQKQQPGEPWAAAMKGHELDPVTAQSDQQRLLLERFQAEHPGFDFSGATFNGQAPNPRTFMGGVDSGLAK